MRPADGVWGNRLGEGSWSGMIGMVMRKVSVTRRDSRAWNCCFFEREYFEYLQNLLISLELRTVNLCSISKACGEINLQCFCTA